MKDPEVSSSKFTQFSRLQQFEEQLLNKARMDSDSSGSSQCSSYREEYWQLKNQYDEVLESNSLMVLRLEEAKLMWFKSTKDLQRQNGVLMTENMNLRAQKEYLLQQLEKFRVLIRNLMKEIESQKISMERQEGYLDELVYQVDSAAKNKDNALKTPDNKASTEEEKDSFLNPTALHELDKQLRASKIESYYLPVIEEEPCGDVDDDDDRGDLVTGDGSEHDDDYHHFNDTRTIINQSALTEPILEVQEFVHPKEMSTLATPSISKIGKRKFSDTTKKRDQKDKTSLREREKTNEKQTPEIKGPLLLAEGVESKPRENRHPTNCAIPETVEQPHRDSNCTRIEPSDDSYHGMFSMVPSTSRQEKSNSSNRSDAQELMETREESRNDPQSILQGHERRQGILQSNWESGRNHPEKQDVSLLKAKEVSVNGIPQQLADELLSIVKNVAASYEAGCVGPKLWSPTNPSDPGRSTDKESMQSDTRLQSQYTAEYSLVPLKSFHERPQVSPQKETAKLSTTRRNDGVLEMKAQQGVSEREKLTIEPRISMNAIFIQQSNARNKAVDAATKRFLDCQDTKENSDPQSQATQSSSSQEAMASEMVRSGKPMEMPYELNEIPLETRCSGKKKTKQRNTDNRQDDARPTEEVLLTLARESHETSHSFIPSNILSPSRNRPNSTNPLGAERDGSLAEQDENSSETNISGLKNENLVQRKTRMSLSISMRDLELPTSRIFRQSRTAGPLDVQRASIASRGRESCCSEFGTPKARRRTGAGCNKELNALSLRRVRSKEVENLLIETAVFLGGMSSVAGSVPNQHRVTRARSKARRNVKEVET